MKILRLERFSATNLISSVFEEQSVQVNDSKHVGICQPTFFFHTKADNLLNIDYSPPSFVSWIASITLYGSGAKILIDV
ncbi:TPA: hypothetical protein ROY05_002477 [Bacillus toyonensis]|uniref:hypothetical protein n=1 Tax=Bacillus cereus group TaxID=86661 RepID=UPI0015CF7BC5|nr:MULTISPECIES: hypothetical protein [Bacillus cereus group]MBJ8076179.1 hypothetical protein [Bacillus cereus group sp. N12]HDX9657860.1 hypothetical protein [Bacillus toyonensis]